MSTFEANVRRGGEAALREVSRFFVKSDAVYQTLQEIANRLNSLNLPYAIVGGMALVVHGYRRTTEDIDILVTPQGLDKIHESLIGLGYLPVFEKSKNLRDTRTGVRIEFLITGQYPGDGKPQAIAFPDPAAVAVEIDEICYARLPTLIELKLASGMSNPGRLRDLADVQELIRVLKLPKAFADKLHSHVRGKFAELAAGILEAEDDKQE